MKITVILTPEASEGDKAVLGNQALESISEALKLKLSGRAQEIKVVAIGQSLSEALRVRLLRQGVDYTLFRACDRCPGLMELAEQFIGIIHMESPDLIFIGRGDNDRQSQLGNMLAELSSRQNNRFYRYKTRPLRAVNLGADVVGELIISYVEASTNRPKRTHRNR